MQDGLAIAVIRDAAISLGDIQNLPTLWVLALFGSFCNFCFHVQTCRHLGGGMCILFEICKKTPFQKCMGLGGRGCHFSAQHNTWDGAHKHSTAPLIHFYSESLSESLFRSMTPLDGVRRVIVVLHVFLHINVNACGQKFMLRSLGGVRLSIPKLGSKSGGLSSRQNVVLLVCACRLLRTGCTRPFRFACRLFTSNLHPVCTARACSFPNQRFLWCIRGCNSTWREFV